MRPTSFSSTLESDPEMSMVLLAIDPEGKTIYKSSNWPVDLNLNGLWTKFPGPRLGEDRPLPPLRDRTNKLKPPIVPPAPPFGEDRLPPPLRDRPPNVPPQPILVTQKTNRGNWRVGLVSFPDLHIAVAVNLNIINQEMFVVENIFVISIVLILFLIAAGAWALSGSALVPIKQLILTIQKVTVNGLNEKVPLDVTDVEFVELIEVFNEMLERLDRSFKQASRFSGDAAHELKTPLAILQGELERTLQQVEMGSEIQERVGYLLDEVHRLSRIVRKLLLLSLADAGQMSLYRVEVNISAILTDMLDDLELIAPHLGVETSIAMGLWVNGDQDLLTQVLQNLLSNAIKYNLPKGWINISAHSIRENVLITISNASEDIPKNERAIIFDRFYRGDWAHSRKVDGAGLGLSLAREIVQAHRGRLTLDSTPSGYTSFSLSLPKSNSQGA